MCLNVEDWPELESVCFWSHLWDWNQQPEREAASSACVLNIWGEWLKWIVVKFQIYDEVWLCDNYLIIFVIICNYVDDYLADYIDDYLDPLII